MAIPFQPSHKPFHLIALTVYVTVVLGLMLIALRWNDRPNSSAMQFLARHAIAVPTITHKLGGSLSRPACTWTFNAPRVEQRSKTDHLMAFTSREVERQGLASPFALHMNFGTEPAT